MYLWDSNRGQSMLSNFQFNQGNSSPDAWASTRDFMGTLGDWMLSNGENMISQGGPTGPLSSGTGIHFGITLPSIPQEER